VWRFDAVAEAAKATSFSSIKKMSDSQRITERSITFCNSVYFRAKDTTEVLEVSLLDILEVLADFRE